MNPPEISVCVCTYKRPALLGQLLDALALSDPATPSFEIVVVDNDAGHSGEATVARHAASAAFPVRYLNQPKQNISLARNCAIHAARGNWLALIDDDERPSPAWLAKLHATARRSGAGIVLGPVLPELPAASPDWIRTAGLFDRPRRKTGATVPYMQVCTGNVLIRRSVALSLEGPFDPHYGLTGGEDIRMLEQLRAGGQAIVWCDEGFVTEAVAPERARLGWLLRRGYRGAQCYARAHLELARSRRARLRRAAALMLRSVLALPVTLLLAAAWLPFDKGRAARWLQRAGMQLGKLSGVLGRRDEGYASPQVTDFAR